MIVSKIKSKSGKPAVESFHQPISYKNFCVAIKISFLDGGSN